MVSLACAIIMLHAVVPHHHDDCCGGVECFFCTEHHHDHCDQHHHSGDSHSPLDCCKLQEMLSHLVLSTKEDEQLFATLLKIESHSFILLAQLASVELPSLAMLQEGSICRPFLMTPLASAPLAGASSLRAPPEC